MTDSNSIIIIGLGRLGQELLTKFPKHFHITIVDYSEGAEEVVRDLRRENIKLIKGDATSRLVLEGCGIDEADAVVITTTVEKVNIEVASVVTSNFNPRRVISLAITEDGQGRLDEMGVETENIFVASALGIRNKIEQRTKTPHAIGIGKEEILEVEVNPNSRLANKKLGLLKPINWRLGIIYREGNIIVPTVETVLRPRDRVVILGDPKVLQTVADVLTFNYEKFPLEYGPILLAYVSPQDDMRYIEEVAYVYSTLPLNKALIVSRDDRISPEADAVLREKGVTEPVYYGSQLSPFGAMEAAMTSYGGPGLILLSRRFLDSMKATFIGDKRRSFLARVIKKAKCPILIGNGTFPYERLVVPCVEGLDFGNVMDTAFQVTNELSSELNTLLPRPSPYISDTDDMQMFRDMQKQISSLASTFKTRANTRELAGNPVNAIVAALPEYSMVITNMQDTEQGSVFGDLLNPDITWGLTKRSPISTMVIPHWEESL